MITLTAKETKLINLLESHGYEIDRESIKRGKYDYSEQGRLDTPTPFVPSEDEFVLHYTGKVKGMNFSATLLLACIRELTPWPQLGWMTDYPQMVEQGDWSGVRDSDENRLWEIFQQYVLDINT